MYLYHIQADSDVPGVGRWVLNGELGSVSSAVSFVDSWAVAPHLVRILNDYDKSGWMIRQDDEWVVDQSLTVFCSDDFDRSIYFDSKYYRRELSGFYLPAAAPMDGSYEGPLFTKVQEFEDIDPMYIYRFEDRWLIGNEYGVDSCSAFLSEPSDYIEDLSSQVWNFSNETGEGFVEEVGIVVHVSTVLYVDICHSFNC
jgi:hypothetical protein